MSTSWSRIFEALVPDEEKDFNLYVLYAPQVEPDAVIDACLRYPMMAERQVVILKEVQSAARKADFLNAMAEYAKAPESADCAGSGWSRGRVERRDVHECGQRFEGSDF